MSGLTERTTDIFARDIAAIADELRDQQEAA